MRRELQDILKRFDSTDRSGRDEAANHLVTLLRCNNRPASTVNDRGQIESAATYYERSLPGFRFVQIGLDDQAELAGRLSRDAQEPGVRDYVFWIFSAVKPEAGADALFWTFTAAGRGLDDESLYQALFAIREHLLQAPEPWLARALPSYAAMMDRVSEMRHSASPRLKAMAMEIVKVAARAK